MRPPLADRLAAVPLERGRVTYVEICHDPWCPAAASGHTDDCRCDPDLAVTLLPRPGRPEG